MIFTIALLLALQLAGLWLSHALNLPIPGAVLGMVFLLIGLFISDKLIEKVRPVASVLLAHLALLFVPAGIGVIEHTERLSAEWLPIVIILFVGTAITMIVTALAVQWAIRWLKIKDQGDGHA